MKNRNNINFNGINNNLDNNMNMIDNLNKSEQILQKLDTNISRISSDNNLGNNSDYDIVNNSISSNK